MTPKSGPALVFRISLANATLLSALYLAAAAVVELSRRFFGARWAERFSLALEVFPARTLDFLGLFEPLRLAWMQGKLTDGEVRVVYGATTVVFIFVLGLVVGAGMWLLAKLLARRHEKIDAGR